MTLSDFREILQEMDRRAGHRIPMFDCMTEQHAAGMFSYTFDTLCEVTVIIAGEAFYKKTMFDTDYRRYENLEAFMQANVAEVTQF